jgi:hypothetical protein
MGEGNKGNDRNLPKGGGRQWIQQSLGTKAAAMARTVVATTARATTTAARVTATGEKRATATIATKTTMAVITVESLEW